MLVPVWISFALVVLAGPAAPKPAVAFLEVAPGGPSLVGLAAEAARGDLSQLPITLVPDGELRTWLRQHDQHQGLLADAGKLLKKGRKLHLGLKLRQAEQVYRQSVAALERGFSRYYQPDIMAEPLLQLGVALFQSGRKDEAQKVFMRVAALAPRLQLAEGYYSPSVRRAFKSAVAQLGTLERGVPAPPELSRICDAASLQGLLVVTAERLGQRPVIRLSLFDASKKEFAAVETTVLLEDRAREQGSELAQRITPALSGMVGLKLPPVEPKSDGGVISVEPADGGVAAGDEDESGWYVRHWWIWPVAAVLIGTAVALPLTVFSEDVVDVRVSY